MCKQTAINLHGALLLVTIIRKRNKILHEQSGAARLGYTVDCFYRDFRGLERKVSHIRQLTQKERKTLSLLARRYIQANWTFYVCCATEAPDDGFLRHKPIFLRRGCSRRSAFKCSKCMACGLGAHYQGGHRTNSFKTRDNSAEVKNTLEFLSLLSTG